MAAKGYERTNSWRINQYQNPCLRRYLIPLKDSGEVVVTGREELEWMIKGIS